MVHLRRDIEEGGTTIEEVVGIGEVEGGGMTEVVVGGEVGEEEGEG